MFQRSGAHTPSAHPSAPPEVKSAFPAFLKKIEGSKMSPSSVKSKQGDQPSYAGFWEAPPRFWNTLPIDEAEIEAIEVSIATRSHNCLILISITADWRWVITAMSLKAGCQMLSHCVFLPKINPFPRTQSNASLLHYPEELAKVPSSSQAHRPREIRSRFQPRLA